MKAFLALALLASQCAPVTTTEQMIHELHVAHERRREAYLTEQACAKRARQRKKELRACARLAVADRGTLSPRTRACLAAVDDARAYTTSLDCRGYEQKVATIQAQLDQAQEACQKIYPERGSKNMIPYLDCLRARMDL